MKFNEFTEQVKGKVEKLLEGKATAIVHEVLKNNGVKLTGISIGAENSNVSPTVYLESYWKKVCSSNRLDEFSEDMIEDIAKDIIKVASKHRYKVNLSLTRLGRTMKVHV